MSTLGSRTILSEHQTRLAARVSRWKWNRWLIKATGGDQRAMDRFYAVGITGFTGTIPAPEHGGRRTRQKWAVLYTPGA
jgi:hypothetical protein